VRRRSLLDLHFSKDLVKRLIKLTEIEILNYIWVTVEGYKNLRPEALSRTRKRKLKTSDMSCVLSDINIDFQQTASYQFNDCLVCRANPLISEREPPRRWNSTWRVFSPADVQNSSLARSTKGLYNLQFGEGSKTPLVETSAKLWLRGLATSFRARKSERKNRALFAASQAYHTHPRPAPPKPRVLPSFEIGKAYTTVDSQLIGKFMFTPQDRTVCLDPLINQ